MNVTQPVGITLIDWANQVVLDLDRFGAFGKLNNENDWQRWAVQFVASPSIDRMIPNPYQFKNWRDWAERFCQAIN